MVHAPYFELVIQGAPVADDVGGGGSYALNDIPFDTAEDKYVRSSRKET